MSEGIWLLGLPIPPSDNNLYANVPKLGRVKASGYRTYQKEVDAWAWSNMKILREARRLASLKPLLSVTLRLKMTRDCFWTRKGTVKRIDVANRLKASLDVLSRLIELDDSHFFHVSITKEPDVSHSLDIYLAIYPFFQK